MNTWERQRWLEARRKGFGASESAGVLDRSPWETSLEVIARKIGMLPEKEPTAPMKWGLRLEEAIASAYEEETGRALTLCEEIMQHHEYSWMLASLDRIQLGQSAGQSRVVELKAVGPWSQKQWGDAGTDQIPQHYIFQVQQQMACADLEVADVAALFSGQDFRIYTVPRNETLINFLVEREAIAWDMVLSKKLPEPNWNHQTTPALIRAMYGVNEGESIDLPEHLCRLADEFNQLGEQERAAKDQRERVKAQLLHAMGTAALAYLPDGSHFVRKEIHRKAYEVKACSYVDFRHKK